ncbi:MAG: Hsp20/alpha crystallin family protein [Chloroflexi bacterium]|nr:Hsp20/alpha crystallin family protein [Chloroflexota bacterium]
MQSYYRGYPRRRRWNGSRTIGFNGGRRMPIDVHSDDEAYLITAAVPGLSAEEVKVEVLDDLVTMSGEITLEENGGSQKILSELRHSFYRQVRLPEAVNADEIEAKVEKGLLTVRIPKADEARPKKIEVKAE